MSKKLKKITKQIEGLSHLEMYQLRNHLDLEIQKHREKTSIAIFEKMCELNSNIEEVEFQDGLIVEVREREYEN